MTGAGVTQAELERYLWGAAVLLRGTIDATDYRQLIFPLLFLKRISDTWDEEYRQALDESGGDVEYATFAEQHRFQIPVGAHWRDLRAVASDVGRAIRDAMRAIEHANPERLDGIFGDAPWTNRDRLSDVTLRDLVEHFSEIELSTANVPEDELGQAYEYLVRRFADDSGHTAQEFYTNRTVVHLMTVLLQPQPGEAVYDPTCGTGGMLLSTAAELRRQGKEHRNLGLYGQELNLISSSIARMNLFLHGISDFRIERGNTLAEPRFLIGDALQRFDVVLANPPYSIKQWDRELWAADPHGRNRFGTPPQGRADYAFLQHILASMDATTGRSATLFPHGVLFRDDEQAMRRRVIEADLIDCVIGLGPGLFYNSPMEACIVLCRSRKPPEREGRLLVVNAVDQYVREQAQSFLREEHIARIVAAYRAWNDEPGFAKVLSHAEIEAHDWTLNIPTYVRAGAPAGDATTTMGDALGAYLADRGSLSTALAVLEHTLR